MKIKIILIIMKHFVFITYLRYTLKKIIQVNKFPGILIGVPNVPGLIPDVDQFETLAFLN